MNTPLSAHRDIPQGFDAGIANSLEGLGHQATQMAIDGARSVREHALQARDSAAGFVQHTRVRQLRAQVIDLYSVARQTLHYNRVSWVVRVGLPTVRAPRMAACSLSMFERPAAGALPLSVTR